MNTKLDEVFRCGVFYWQKRLRRTPLRVGQKGTLSCRFMLQFGRPPDAARRRKRSSTG